MWVLYGKSEYEGIFGTIIWRNMRLPFHTRKECVTASRQMHNNGIGWIATRIVWEPWIGPRV